MKLFVFWSFGLLSVSWRDHYRGNWSYSPFSLQLKKNLANNFNLYSNKSRPELLFFFIIFLDITVCIAPFIFSACMGEGAVTAGVVATALVGGGSAGVAAV
jgi:hypothetical protein